MKIFVILLIAAILFAGCTQQPSAKEAPAVPNEIPKEKLPAAAPKEITPPGAQPSPQPLPQPAPAEAAKEPADSDTYSDDLDKATSDLTELEKG